ncbi:MAG: phosphatidylglycerophosphatase A [Deltaproteobacteria bacterium]|nr:MAG: phosphatidylglycerophosphatase A [Deltaproteobacteria bacterium]
MMTGPQQKNRFWNEFAKARALHKVSLVLSTWFFCGLLPGAPGTYGTAAAVIVGFFAGALPIVYRSFVVVAFIAVAVYTSSVSASLLKQNDPKEVVIDEVAGYLLTVFALPASLLSVVLAFIFFRVFDILKPFPIRQVEKRVRGGLGIVLDDLLAGIFAFVIVRLVLVFMA